MKKKSVNVFFLFFYLFVPCTLFAREVNPVKIGILQGVKEITLKANNELIVLRGGKDTTFRAGKYSLVFTKDGLKIGKKIFSLPVTLSSSEPLSINGCYYRGNFILRQSSANRFSVINQVDLEGYLYGVLKAEISPGWPLETLKAQAVAARTYALKNSDKHQDADFDLCSEVHCQVYRGLSAEDPTTNAAVDLTKNEVLIYKGELIDAYFHSTCGGYTDNAVNVWGRTENPEYLEGVKDKFCAESPHFSWECSVSKEQIARKLRKRGYPVGKIKKIKLEEKGRGGRISKLEIVHQYGKTIIPASQFRVALGENLLRSTFFEIKTYSDAYLFQGKGWGHGVGFCQWGAYGMGLKGYNYKEILEHYYPGTKVKKYE